MTPPTQGVGFASPWAENSQSFGLKTVEPRRSDTTDKSIRSDNTAVRWVQNTLSVVGFVPPDENDLVKRIIAVGGQTVECCDEDGRVTRIVEKPQTEEELDRLCTAAAWLDARGVAARGREYLAKEQNRSVVQLDAMAGAV